MPSPRGVILSLLLFAALAAVSLRLALVSFRRGLFLGYLYLQRYSSFLTSRFTVVLMSISAFLTLLGVWTLGCISPGPDVVMVLTQALRGRALPAALGVVTGLSIWIVLSLAGISWFTSRYAPALRFLPLAGGAFLLIYGSVVAWRASHPARQARLREGMSEVAAWDAVTRRSPAVVVSKETGQDATSDVPVPTRRGAYFAGLATNLTNPKALAFFAALFASLLPQESSMLLAVAIAANMITIALLWFCALALVTGMRQVQAVLQRHEQALGLFLGAVLAVLGVATIFANW